MIDVAAKTGYFMDPQGNSPVEHIKELVINGINMFAATSGKKRVHSEFKIVQVPKQPGSYECGYYVILYMRDIIVDPSLLFNNKWMRYGMNG